MQERLSAFHITFARIMGDANDSNPIGNVSGKKPISGPSRNTASGPAGISHGFYCKHPFRNCAEDKNSHKEAEELNRSACHNALYVSANWRKFDRRLDAVIVNADESDVGGEHEFLVA